jgi:uncharacterized membrane protein
MMQLWILLTIIGYMIGAVAGTMDKYMMNKRYHPVTTVLLRTFFNAVFLGAAGILLVHIQITTHVLLLAVLPAFLLALSFVVYLGVLQKKNATEVQPFSQSLDVLFIFLASIIVLHEPANILNYLGILFTFVGVYLVLTEDIRKIPRLDRNLLIIIALVPLDIIYALLLKTFLASAEPIALAVSIYFMAFLMLAVVSFVFRPQKNYPFVSLKTQMRSVLIASVCAAAAIAFLYTALSQANASKVYPMAGVSSITVFFLATLFLKERFHWHRFIGTLIIVAGIFLISL